MLKKVNNLPNSPGVYFFLAPITKDKNKKGEILYIGKATSLKNRVRSYFSEDILDKRGPLIQKMMSLDVRVKYIKTDSVLEALLLEAELIKKYSPPYNVKGKDERSWNFVVITKESFPRVLIKRERELKDEYQEKFGPFPKAGDLRLALKIIRKIFPFRDKCELGQKRPCFNAQINLCSGVCVGNISEKDYKKNITNIKLFFQGKKKTILKNLEKEMKVLVKERNFEKAQEIKKKIFALNHINDITLIKSELDKVENGFRIEAYDISHMAGVNIVGVMTVIENGEIKKSDYRKFKIKEQQGSDDVRALKEIIRRRFDHNEWSKPNLIVVDGGVAQVNGVKSELQLLRVDIPVVGVVKDDKHKAKGIIGSYNKSLYKDILLANSESHRFAITFHRSKTLQF